MLFGNLMWRQYSNDANTGKGSKFWAFKCFYLVKTDVAELKL